MIKKLKAILTLTIFQGLYLCLWSRKLLLTPCIGMEIQTNGSSIWPQRQGLSLEHPGSTASVSFQKQNAEIWNPVAQLLSPIKRRAQIQIHLQNQCFLFLWVYMFFEPNIWLYVFKWSCIYSLGKSKICILYSTHTMKRYLSPFVPIHRFFPKSHQSYHCD